MENNEYDFLLEKRLKELSPELSANFRDIVFCMRKILEKNDTYFPAFTDHTTRHSLFVLEFENRIIGPENIKKLNADEIYILMCSAYMHDFGMTVSAREYEKFKEGIVPEDFFEKHPDATLRDCIRIYHNEFSGAMVSYYSDFFDFPSKEHAYCVAQVCRGHRKTDLFDRNEYDPAFKLPNGSTVCLPYLSAVMRLTDEMDITRDRNSIASYEEHLDNIHYRQHYAVKSLDIENDRFVIHVDTSEKDVRDECVSIIKKLDATLAYCRNVSSSLTPFEITQKSIDTDFTGTAEKSAVILDTDAGTDDAIAMSLINYMGDLKPDYIIATPGNASAEQAVKNVIILKKLFGFASEIVKGGDPEDLERMAEKNTFHGPDGLGGLSEQIARETGVTPDDLRDYISLDSLMIELCRFDSIIYISIGPLNTLASMLDNPALKDKFTNLYIMGGGIHEFNCEHNTEFNFSKAPKAVSALLKSGADITLFPLDLTNHQTLGDDDIIKLKESGVIPSAVSLLEFNKTANSGLNGIDGAVMHDSMPVLYLIKSEAFKMKGYRLSSDENGALHESADGAPVRAAEKIEPGLLINMLEKSLKPRL